MKMMAKIPLGGDIVEEYQIGNTRIYICDAAFKNNTPEDNKRVLEAAARASLNIIRNRQRREQEREQDDRAAQ
nr:MAG TPA: hypothetical protein [Caudoviricetes sp.]